MSPFCQLCNTIVTWLRGRWRQIIKADVSAFSWPLSLATIGWGIILASHGDLFSHSVYLPLATVAPEWLWSLVMFGLGSVLLSGALVNSKRVLRIGLIGCTALWTFTACTFLLTGAPTGGLTYGILAWMSGWELMQIGPKNGQR